MRMTQLFTRTLKQAPAGEVARNAQHESAAGRYAPLHLLVLVLRFW